MKKLLSLTLGLGMLFSVVACSGDQTSEPVDGGSKTVETYSVYSMQVEAGATYKAFSPDGSELEVLNGAFAIRGAGKYTYQKTLNGVVTVYTLNAKDTTAPEVRLSYTKKYAKANEAIALPEIEVVDADGTNVADVVVYDEEGNEVTVTDGTITPETLGEYTVAVTSVDKSENETTQTATIVCTDNEYELNTIYEFSTAWGLENQTAQRQGIRAELTDELAPNGEVACKFNMTTPDYFSSNNNRKHEMYLINPMQVNWSEQYSKVYFWVNNQTQYAHYVRFFNLQIYVAPNSGWVKIEFSEFDLLGGDGASYETTIDPEDCVGTYLCLQRTVQEFTFGTFYVSNIYGEPKPVEDVTGGEQQ